MCASSRSVEKTPVLCKPRYDDGEVRLTKCGQLGAQLDITSLLLRCHGFATLRPFLYPALKDKKSKGFEDRTNPDGHRKDAFEKLGEAFNLEELQWLAMLYQRRANLPNPSVAMEYPKGDTGPGMTRGLSAHLVAVASSHESKTVPASLGFYQNVSIPSSLTID